MVLHFFIQFKEKVVPVDKPLINLKVSMRSARFVLSYNVHSPTIFIAHRISVHSNQVSFWWTCAESFPSASYPSCRTENKPTSCRPAPHAVEPQHKTSSFKLEIVRFTSWKLKGTNSGTRIFDHCVTLFVCLVNWNFWECMVCFVNNHAIVTWREQMPVNFRNLECLLESAVHNCGGSKRKTMESTLSEHSSAADSRPTDERRRDTSFWDQLRSIEKICPHTGNRSGTPLPVCCRQRRRRSNL